jgi:hypothetical protein
MKVPSSVRDVLRCRDRVGPPPGVAEVRVPERDAMAAHAAAMITDGRSVPRDIGTTAYRAAR